MEKFHDIWLEETKTKSQANKDEHDTTKHFAPFPKVITEMLPIWPYECSRPWTIDKPNKGHKCFKEPKEKTHLPARLPTTTPNTNPNTGRKIPQAERKTHQEQAGEGKHVGG